MKIVEYKVEIAAFEPESIPSKDIVEVALEETVENIETNGGNVTVKASFVRELTIDTANTEKSVNSASSFAEQQKKNNNKK